VCVAGNSIETARLLLLSGSPQFPDGLANSSGQVGRNYMRHLTASSYARFEQPVRMYRGETMAGIIADESRLDDSRGFVGGFYLETLSLGPAFLAAFADPARGARPSPRSWTATRTPPACGSWARTCRRPPTGSR
jgi:choline dehydrogenase-like flavoprotein